MRGGFGGIRWDEQSRQAAGAWRERVEVLQLMIVFQKCKRNTHGLFSERAPCGYGRWDLGRFEAYS
jgi:hypothetical protein